MGEMASQNSTEIFEKHYDAYADVVFRLCLYKTSNHDIAEDLMADVFTKYYNYLQTNDPPKKPKSFIYQIARNLIIDYYRKGKTESLELHQEHGGDQEDVQYGDTHTVNSAEYRIVLETLDQLDEPYRETLYLNLVEGYGPSELAEMLDISASNASVRINRGKKQLKKLLAP